MQRRSLVGRLILWIYVFYLSKYYELLDTVILLLKGRPLIFLHWYHHFITLLLVWACLMYGPPLTPLVSCANCAVHVFMYYYYMRAARGKPADKKFNETYKELVTSSQIVQFLIDELLSVLYIVAEYRTNWSCSGKEPTLFGIVVITSFLLLFMSFYAKNYGRKFFSRASREAEAAQKKM